MSEDKEYVQLSTGIIKSCEVCKVDIAYNNIADQINHYLGHGYKVVHVGTETFGTEKGLEHFTVAMLSRR